MKVRLTLMLFLVLLCLVVAATKENYGSIYGSIFEKCKDAFVANISVQCIQNQTVIGTVISDDNGFYRFAKLKPGTYTIKISDSQYQTYENKKVIVVANKPAKLNIVLIARSAKPVPEKAEETGSLSVNATDIAGNPLESVKVTVLKGSEQITQGKTDSKGQITFAKIPVGSYTIKYSLINYEDVVLNDCIIDKEKTTNLFPVMISSRIITTEFAVAGGEPFLNRKETGSSAAFVGGSNNRVATNMFNRQYVKPPYMPPYNTEQYAAIQPNIFHSPLAEPLSTFSIDVDTGCYSNIRRILQQNQLPEPQSIRIEELLNYFAYNYPQPKGEHPFSVYTEMSVCPWNQKRNLVLIGLQAKKLDFSKAAPSNLVFLLDVSGSMNQSNKLPLVKESMRLLVDNLRDKDKIAIVVYAGAAGEVLPSTSAKQKNEIYEAIDRLQAGGSTAGGAGIELAYKIAEENLIKDGNNRIILCTDGDFNVGASSSAHLTDLIESKRIKGIFLTALGYGMGNYKDNTLELLADKGNGNYAYIDDISEAKKVLVNEMASTLYTVAKDVKLQIEFNPAHIKAYRLIGYENRLLNKEDFKDDTKDAGEIGAGHCVTAVYEIIPASSKEPVPELDELKYQDIKISDEARKSPEALTVKLRYKLPDSDTSIPFDVPVMNKTISLENASENYLFASSVIGYGMLLQDSEYKAALTWDMVNELASKNIGKDTEGYRAEFLNLIDIAAKLQEKQFREENRDYNKEY